MKKNYSEEDILQVLARRVKKYTSNESTSISYDKARQLMGSVLYCLKEGEITGGEDDKNLSLINMSAQEIFEVGLDKKKKKIEAAKRKYEEVLKSFHFYENLCYCDTIIEGMPEFFKWYDVEFDGENHILTLDYPLMNPVSDRVGIDLIYEYLKRVDIEKRFLNHFAYDKIMEMLQGYDKKHADLIINLVRLVFRNAIGCLLVEKPIDELLVTKGERELLYHSVYSKEVEELERIISEALIKMMQKEFRNDKGLLEYLRKDVRAFAVELKVALENKHLESLFISSSESEDLIQSTYQDGNMMEDEMLRTLINEISAMRFLEDKLELIKQQVRSLEDLEEILKECFDKDEYQSVFQLLSEVEIQVLKEKIKQKVDFDEELNEWEKAFENHVSVK